MSVVNLLFGECITITIKYTTGVSRGAAFREGVARLALYFIIGFLRNWELFLRGFKSQIRRSRVLVRLDTSLVASVPPPAAYSSLVSRACSAMPRCRIHQTCDIA
ncbi:hypothetical protein F5B21DRAFT_104710 [Xylaria acuta]|nr:hypothetical protein F5B21DRAFT_104710 [Xylaria acuta]